VTGVPVTLASDASIADPRPNNWSISTWKVRLSRGALTPERRPRGCQGKATPKKGSGARYAR